MADIQKREEDALETRDEGGMSRVVYWGLLVAAFLAIGVVVMLFGPWLLTAALVLGGAYAIWWIVTWWLGGDSEDVVETDPLLEDDDREAELGSEIALEDLRERTTRESD